MDYKRPLVVHLIPYNTDSEGRPNDQDRNVYQNGDVLSMPNYGNYNDFKKALHENMSSGEYDSVILSTKGYDINALENQKQNGNFNTQENRKIDKEIHDQIKSVDIKSRSVLSEAYKNKLSVYNIYQGQAYDLNTFFGPHYNTAKTSDKKATAYAPSDAEVLERKSHYTKDQWEHRQSLVYKHLKPMMPLSSGDRFDKNKTNNLAELMAPKRGLEKQDLNDFFSWESGKAIIPSLMQDDMLGVAGIDAATINDTISYHGKQIGGSPIHLKTRGMPGYAIPMKNLNGDIPKYQIGSDISPYGIILKAKASDGISIEKSEYQLKQKNLVGGSTEYNFKMDGKPSRLCVEDADEHGNLRLRDVKGPFNANLKQDIKPQLEERGYEIPPIIDNIKPMQGAKYMWIAPGNMIGSKAINKDAGEDKAVSPNQCGFVSARKPQNGNKNYVVLVAEGALKGRIAAKYMNHKDETGQSLGDKIAGDRGIIVAQVPGVAASYVKSVERIYENPHFKGHIDGTYIAMDADGRENLNVANGIHEAYDELKQYNGGKVSVMSWDPAQKGIDDALLAVANHKIQLDDMNVHFGGPDQEFPLDKAKSKNPYRLDGSRVNKVTWQADYAESSQKAQDRLHEAQENAKHMNQPQSGNGDNKEPSNDTPQQGDDGNKEPSNDDSQKPSGNDKSFNENQNAKDDNKSKAPIDDDDQPFGFDLSDLEKLRESQNGPQQ